MLGLFKSASFVDPQLGELHRSRGAWRGTLKLDGEAPVTIILSEPRSAGRRSVAHRTVLAFRLRLLAACDRTGAIRSLLTIRAEAVAAGELDAPSSGLPPIDAPSSVWGHTTLVFVQVTPLGGVLTVEIGYRVAWDEEHTLGARFRAGQLLELCGSVLAP